jgi:hypothetical protein
MKSKRFNGFSCVADWEKQHFNCSDLEKLFLVWRILQKSLIQVRLVLQSTRLFYGKYVQNKCKAKLLERTDKWHTA